MRNGNGKVFSGVVIMDSTFYPTYEEWKLAFHQFPVLFLVTFYPTYEEWKPCTIHQTIILCFTFYPTYEEWKQSSGFHFWADMTNSFLSYL